MTHFVSHLVAGKVLLTCGIASLPLVQQNEVINKVKKFNDFTEDNDPYGEHDFGYFDYREINFLENRPL